MAYLTAIIGFGPNTVVLNTARGLGGCVSLVQKTSKRFWNRRRKKKKKKRIPGRTDFFFFFLNTLLPFVLTWFHDYFYLSLFRQIATSMIYGSQVFSNKSFIAMASLTNIPATIVKLIPFITFLFFFLFFLLTSFSKKKKKSWLLWSKKKKKRLQQYLIVSWFWFDLFDIHIIRWVHCYISLSLYQS